jgi:hypothetical protein
MPALDERSGLQALYFLLDDAVALAGGCFQTLVVENPRARLDLEKLRASLGEEYAVADLVARSVCSECGSRWPQLSLTVSPVSFPRVVRSPPSA